MSRPFQQWVSCYLNGVEKGRNIGSRLAIACHLPRPEPGLRNKIMGVVSACLVTETTGRGWPLAQEWGAARRRVRHIFMGSLGGPAMELQEWNSTLKFCLLCGQIESSSSLFQGLLASFSSQTTKQCCGVRTERFYLVA